MNLFRVVPHLPDAPAGEPGHPMYVPEPQGRGRIDNPDLYSAWYFGTTPTTAVGETFGDLAEWSDDMFWYPALQGRRSLVTYTLDDPALLDLDNPNALIGLGIKPTQVVTRHRPTTQGWARAAYLHNQWDGLLWWSFHRPHWTVVGLWQPNGTEPRHRDVTVEPLTMDHPAVVAAAAELAKRT